MIFFNRSKFFSSKSTVSNIPEVSERTSSKLNINDSFIEVNSNKHNLRKITIVRPSGIDVKTQQELAKELEQEQERNKPKSCFDGVMDTCLTM